MKYFFGVLAVVLAAIIAIVMLTRTPDTTTSGQKPGGKPAVKLLDYVDKTGSQTQWTMQGKLVGEEQRRAIRVSVSESERRVEILQGYEERVERSASYPNTRAAYETFLRALDVAGFTRERKVAITDERGVCPIGNRYIYNLWEGSEHPVRTWSATCSGALGTFAGNPVLTQQLFQLQIPDYAVQTRGVQLF